MPPHTVPQLWGTPVFVLFLDLPNGPEDYQCLCCLHSSLFHPCNTKVAKTVVFSEIKNSPDLQANRWPLLCTVHFSFLVCVITQSPNDGCFFFCWILLNIFCCHTPCSTWRKPPTEFDFYYLKHLLPCAARKITPQTLVRIFKCQEAQRHWLILCLFFNLAYGKDRSFKIDIVYDTTYLILSLLFTNFKCVLEIDEHIPKSAITV